MRMRIDATGNDEFSRSVDSVVRLHVELRPDNGDAFIFNQNVGLVIIDRGDDAAILIRVFMHYSAKG